MRKLTGLTLVGTLAVLLLGGTALGVDGSTRDAVQALRAGVPGVGIYEEAGRITRLYGPPLATGATPEQSAALFLESHAGVFGVSAGELELVGFPGGDDLVQPVMFDGQTGDYKFYLYRYEQRRDGVRVYGADLRLLVRNLPGYPLVLAAANLRPLGDFIVTHPRPKIDADLARAAVMAATQSDTTQARMLADLPPINSFTDLELVIWAGLGHDNVTPRMAVTYIGDNGLAGTSEHVRWRFVADATTGEILHSESLVIFEDVVGNVSGMATPGPKAMQCTSSALMPFPYATVSISGGNSTYADANGDFVISNGGTSAVTVLSPMRGLYFRVNNAAGGEDDLSQSVTPPGPADFTHNAADSSELVRAQANGYVNANEVRDFALAQNPAYPVIASQTDFDVNVNLTSGYCPGNAWYDGVSINFCRSSSGYANTSFASVSQHEYGHHLVESGGSGQGQYGEGMGDTISMLLADDPRLGVGFFTSDCSNGIRNADNNYQYPCSGEIHDCGQLISGAVWSTRNELLATEPVDYLNIISNLAVNSILLHSGDLITPSITIDYLTLDDDDANINNGTPHYNEIDAGFGAHNMPAPPIDLIDFEYPDGLPQMLSPGQPTVVRVNVVAVSGSPVPGTGTVSVRVGGGAFTTTAMTQTAPNEYEATLPAADCLELVDFYFSADDAGGMTISDPRDAPSAFHTALVATGSAVAMDDNFETDQGWTVQNSGGLTDGAWDRGVPVGGGDRGDPPTDYDGSGQCYLTHNADGNTDVDGGTTYLISPAIDLSGGDGEVSFALWYTNNFGADPNNDLFKIWVSNDGGSTWTLVETVGPVTSNGWTVHTFVVGGFVTPSAQVKVRFEASDLNSGSVVEAGVDAFHVTRLECNQTSCPGDLNGDNSIDLADLSILLANYGASGASYEDGDLTGDGNVDLADLSELLAVYGTTCP